VQEAFQKASEQLQEKKEKQNAKVRKN